MEKVHIHDIHDFFKHLGVDISKEKEEKQISKALQQINIFIKEEGIRYCVSDLSSDFFTEAIIDFLISKVYQIEFLFHYIR